ncbi:hypothetical protein ACWEKM_03620 [Streptomyces sp. NPDC004752]
MSRLSREEKREHERGAGPAARVDVRVSAAGEATVDGVPLAAAPGREIQHAVLDHLQCLARTLGHPVRAAIHDGRVGYVIPLQVDTNGASRFTGDPARMTPKAKASGKSGAASEPEPGVPGRTGERETSGEPADGPSAGFGRDSAADAAADAPAAVAAAADAAAEPSPYRDEPAHVPRPVVEPVLDVAPTFPLRAVPEPPPHAEPAGTVAPPPVADLAPGAVKAPTGVFGPPPVMPAAPSRPADPPGPTEPPRPAEPPRPIGPIQATVPKPSGTPEADATTGSAPDWVSQAAVSGAAVSGTASPSALGVPGPPRTHRPPAADFPAEADPDPRPTPARGFDAVAEAVLGDRDDSGTVLGEPTARINEAVRAGRIDAAAELAKRTVEAAAADLGPDHPEVLRLRELTAYIAYLSGDPLHAFRLSLDLARLRHHSRDPEAAYGNVQSAAAAWRAVRDPGQGLSLGRDLIALWTELTAEGSPAADDIEQLKSARARMVRLTERAARAAD